MRFWRKGDEDGYWVVSLSLSSFRVSLQLLLLCRSILLSLLRIGICASPTEVSDLVVVWRHCSLYSEADGAEARSASQVSDRGADACTAAVRVAVGDRAFQGDGGSPRCTSCQSGPLLTGGFRVLCA
ncbi:hypothetical protein F2Q69_00062614 [Brassica cretica]|uniref:Uncharacterized protein n=1 Tax=Brassica cretica TaxID=69181 RepID=A0A8S9RJL1_BRACR|nr:hypothetical protein F2Q69_00062614 [Brassica cretica]